MSNLCPVCGYTDLYDPPYLGKGGVPYSGADGQGTPSHEICPSCGYQFGWTDYDQHISHEQWREKWIAGGMVWYKGRSKPPENWNPREQLLNVGVKL